MSSDKAREVPEGFPRTKHLASVSGFQAKVPVRLIDGKYVGDWTDAELFDRYEVCEDLVTQLTAYSHRKLAELPGATLQNLLPRVRRGILNKGWDLTDAELDWIMARVAMNMTQISGDSGAT